MSTVEPSTPNVSVAVMQVVMPGSVESIAVSSVQSMKAPFGSRNRRVGSTEAATAGVTVGRSNPFNGCAGSPTAPPVLCGAVGIARPSTLGGDAGKAPGSSAFGSRANAGPASRRSNASSPGDFAGGAPDAGASDPKVAPRAGVTAAGSGGAGPKTCSIAGGSGG